MQSNCDPIGVFDSGVGGLSVLRACVSLMPGERYIYLADKANMPYGNKSAEFIKHAALLCADRLFALNCKAVVIACNTATATAAQTIRSLYATRVVVGLEPAVKPCFRELKKGGYGVALVTEATYRSERFKSLLLGCDNRIVALPAPELAALIECADRERVKRYIEKTLAPYRTAQSVVLGCSHYSHAAGIIKDFYDGDVKIYDGADGAARRLKYCLQLFGSLSDSKTKPPITFLSTV